MTTERQAPPSPKRPREASVGTKLAVVIVILMSVLSVGVYFGLSRSMSHSLLTSKGETARALAQLFTSSVSAAVVFDDADAIQEALGHLAKNGDVVYAGVWSAGDQTPGRRLGQYARHGEPPVSSVRAVEHSYLHWGKDVLSLSVPIRDESGEVIAHTLIEFSLRSENMRIDTIRSRVLFGSVGLAAVVVLLVLAVSRRTILLPLQRLQAAARRLERGESAEFDVGSGDEVGQLGAALRQMARAVEEREAEITQRNDEMRLVMDNVGQGFLTLDTEGAMSGEHSRAVEEWFGEPQPGERFDAYLARVDPKTADWFHAAWEQLREGFLPVELAVDQLPKRVTNQDKVWRLEYRPVVTQDETLDKLIIVITDVTLLLEKERTERQQREVISALSRMSRDSHGFIEFLAEGDALVERLERGDSEDVASTSRQIHTLKGTAAVMDVDSVAAFCHALEERLMGVHRALNEDEKLELRQVWDGFRDKISPLVAARNEEAVVIQREQYDSLVRAIEAGASQARLLEQVRDWNTEATEHRLDRLAQHAQRLAERLGKGPLDIAISSGNIRTPPGACGSLWNELVHAVRNAVDHGFETADERQEVGKPEMGKLTLETKVEGQKFVVSVSDDGRGIDWESVRARAKALGLPHETAEELKDALLRDGLTTRDAATETSGRGFGTAALATAIEGLGGHLEIESVRGHGTTFRVVLPRRVLSGGGPTTGTPRSADRVAGRAGV